MRLFSRLRLPINRTDYRVDEFGSWTSGRGRSVPKADQNVAENSDILCVSWWTNTFCSMPPHVAERVGLLTQLSEHFSFVEALDILVERIEAEPRTMHKLRKALKSETFDRTFWTANFRTVKDLAGGFVRLVGQERIIEHRCLITSMYIGRAQ